MTVKTGKVSGRRSLRFSSFDELLAEASRLSAMPTRQLGNWSLGQICEHLAKGMDMAVDGPPFTMPIYVRLVGPFLKKRILTRRMSSGFTLPKSASALLPAPIGTAEGLARLEESVRRLRQTTDRKPHGIFGRLTVAEWDQLQFRHAEMHLSFIEPA
jgi:hypothetical protein